MPQILWWAEQFTTNLPPSLINFLNNFRKFRGVTYKIQGWLEEISNTIERKGGGGLPTFIKFHVLNYAASIGSRYLNENNLV